MRKEQMGEGLANSVGNYTELIISIRGSMPIGRQALGQNPGGDIRFCP